MTCRARGSLQDFCFLLGEYEGRGECQWIYDLICLLCRILLEEMAKKCFTILCQLS